MGDILIEEKAVHLTSCRVKWCFRSSEEKRMHSNTSSRVSEGYSSKTSSAESPAARNSKMVCAVILVPLITGWPLQISGSIIILFIVGRYLMKTTRAMILRKYLLRDPPDGLAFWDTSMSSRLTGQRPLSTVPPCDRPPKEKQKLEI